MSIDNKQQLLKKLNYKFHDESLLLCALRHRSAGANHNERLEFLGDAVLSLIIATALFEKFPKAREGQLSRLRSIMVNRDTLADIARQLQLGDYLILGAGEYKSGGTNRDSILADSLEAIIGAIYIDSDIDNCRQCLLNFYQPRLEQLTLKQTHKDAKTELQEYLQSLREPLPEYELKAIIGKEHKQKFVVSCRCTLFSKSIEGLGGTRRRAEQDVARKMLEALKSV